MISKIVYPFEYTRQDNRLFEARICTDEHSIGPLVCLINRGFADSQTAHPGSSEVPIWMYPREFVRKYVRNENHKQRMLEFLDDNKHARPEVFLYLVPCGHVFDSDSDGYREQRH